MAWVVFNVVRNGNTADGQMQLTLASGSTGTLMKAGSTLQYSNSAASPPPTPTIQTVFTTTADISIANGAFSIPDATLPNNFHIPAKGVFSGGTFAFARGMSYNPTGKVIRGRFTNDPGSSAPPGSGDDDCNWLATNSEPDTEVAETQAKGASY